MENKDTAQGALTARKNPRPSSSQDRRRRIDTGKTERSRIGKSGLLTLLLSLAWLAVVGSGYSLLGPDSAAFSIPILFLALLANVVAAWRRRYPAARRLFFLHAFGLFLSFWIAHRLPDARVPEGIAHAIITMIAIAVAMVAVLGIEMLQELKQHII